MSRCKGSGCGPAHHHRHEAQVPVGGILQGTEIEQVADRGSTDDPSALQRFAEYRAERARKGRVQVGRVGLEPTADGL